MAIIKVFPEELAGASTKLWNQINLFNSWQARLYADVDAMKTSWKGEANQNFTKQIYAFRNEFKALEDILSQYAEFLKAAAVNYEDTEHRLAEIAKHLSAISEL